MGEMQNIIDEELERLWNELEDIPFVESKDGKLLLDMNWYGFSVGTSRTDVWKWFDKHHSRGINYLLNERYLE